MLAMTLMVGFAKNGSMHPVSGVRNRQHVGFVNPHPATNRRPVESQAFLERVRIPEIDGIRTVLPRAEHVDELEVDHVDLVFLREREEVVRFHSSGASFLHRRPVPARADGN